MRCLKSTASSGRIVLRTMSMKEAQWLLSHSDHVPCIVPRTVEKERAMTLQLKGEMEAITISSVRQNDR